MTLLSFSSPMIKASNTGPQETVFLHWNDEGTPPTPIKTMSTPSPARAIQKKKTTRRAGSCEPCRKSKIKCDGRKPKCTGCARRKRAKCKDACVYIPAKERSAAARQQQTDKVERHARSTTSPLSTIGEYSDESDVEVSSPPPHRGPPNVYGKEEFFGFSSLARCIDKFKSLCPATHVSAPDAVIQCNGIAAFDAVLDPIDQNEFLLPRSQHSLSHYLPSTHLEGMPPELRSMAWKAINMKEQMVDEGRMFEAYKDFPSLAREARFFRRLNMKSRSKSIQPNRLQAQVEQRIYRIIVDMDIRICTHLGMPLEVQPDQIAPSTTLTASDDEPSALILEKSQSRFRQLAFDILTLLPDVDTDDEGAAAEGTISELSTLWDQLRELCSETSTIPDAPKNIRLLFIEHQIDCLALSMLLACTLGNLRKDLRTDVTLGAAGKRKRKAAAAEPDYTTAALKSAQDILSSFAGIGELTDGCSWTCAYAVFCAAAMTSIAIVNGTCMPDSVDNIKQAVDYFGKATRQQGKGYGLASAPLGKLWAKVKAVTDLKTLTNPSKQTSIPSSPIISADPKLIGKSPAGGRRKRQTDTLDDNETEHPIKRSRRSPEVTRSNMTPICLTYGPEMAMNQAYHQGFSSGYSEPTYMWNPGYDVSAATSAKVSFSSVVPTEAAPDMAGYPHQQPTDGHYYLPLWWHPPMTGPNPPYTPELQGSVPRYGNDSYQFLLNHNNSPASSPIVRGAMHDTRRSASLDAWPVAVPNDGMPVPIYYHVPPQQSRRPSMVSQHDNHTAHPGWQVDSTAIAGVPIQQYHNTNPAAMYYVNEEMPAMRDEWRDQERCSYGHSASGDGSPWQMEQQGHHWTTIVS